jgi:citrate lyase subunit beta/citryl-CoA lyase
MAAITEGGLMPDAIRPRRSALYVPGANKRALEKARTLDADVLIFDLEDAVADSQKEASRDNVVAALKEGGYKAETVVRVNDPTTKLGAADLKAVARSGCHAVLLPKIEKPRQVSDAHLRLASAGAPADQKLWAMIETPLAVLHVEEIAFSSPHLTCLVMGTSDLAKDLRARHTALRLPFLTLLSISVLAARAAGLVILDGVYLELDNDQGFLDSCQQGAELGFDGKTLLHPKTVAGANAAFGPTDAEIAWAKKIIAAHAEAVSQGKGVLVVDGKFVENLHVDSAKQTLALADAIAARKRA